MGTCFITIRTIAFFFLMFLCLSNVSAKEGSFDKESYKEMLHLNGQMFELIEHASEHASDEHAIPLAKRALELAEKMSRKEPNDLYVADALLALGKLYRVGRANDSNTVALPFLERAFGIFEKVLGLSDWRTLDSLHSLSSLYDAIGDRSKAISLRLRAQSTHKAVSSNQPDKDIWQNQKSEMGLNILQSPQFAEVFKEGLKKKTLPNLQSQYESFEKLYGPDNPGTAIWLNSIAELYLYLGDYNQAEPRFIRALAIREKAFGPDHLDIVPSLNGLAVLYAATGAYSKAKPFLLRALTLSRKPPVTAYAAGTESALRAVDLYEKVLGPDHTATALALDILADFYRVAGTYAQAEPIYKRALTIREQMLGSNHPDTATSRDKLIELYRITGANAQAELLSLHTRANAQAEQLHQDTLIITEKEQDPGDPAIASSLNNLAESYYATGAYTQAEPLYKRALKIREKVLGLNHPDTLVSLRNLAVLYYAMDDYARVVPLMERAQKAEEDNTVKFLSFAKESRKRAYVQQRIRNVDVDISFSLATTDPRAKVLGLTDVLQYKGRVLGASSAYLKVRRRSFQGYMPDFSPRHDVLQKFSAMLFRGPGDLSYSKYEDQLKRLAQEQEDWEAEEFEVSSIEFERVRKNLPVDGVLVEWFRYRPFDSKAKNQSARWGAPHYVAYMLKSAGDVVALDLGEAEPIDKLVTHFREKLETMNNSDYEDAGRKLFEKLIAPLRTHLAQSKKLLLSPDGELNLVPFAALLGEDGKYLIHHYEITYLTSGSELLQINNSKDFSRDWPVVMAYPDYGQATSRIVPVAPGLEASRAPELDRSGLMFPPLAGVKAEASMLQSLFKLDDTHLFTGTKATETRLKELHGPRILHLATHGFFFPDEDTTEVVVNPVEPSPESLMLTLAKNPMMRSGLALAGANVRRESEIDDGILTAAEVSKLDLRGTQLVVLSACDTGTGHVQQGEGVYGLRRALVLAGAETQVVSLWKVDDAATQSLMEDYYERLIKKGEGRSEALRSAQLRIKSNPLYRHPFFWAAFLPIGNWTPLH